MSDGGEVKRGAIRADADVRAMFGRIARRYDLMNRLMTGGRDRAWRRLAVAAAIGGYPRRTARVLDVATGTGDLALALAVGGAGRVVGVDFAAPMLRAAVEKSGPRWYGRPRPEAPGRTAVPEPAWIVADALALPFPDDVFDACTVAFGLRNMASYPDALREMARVLRPGGRLVCLELTPFRAPLVGAAFDWYFGRVVPLVGGWLSGDRGAYGYLPESVAAFPDAQALARLMEESGFATVTHRLLGAGAVALHVATKPSHRDGE